MEIIGIFIIFIDDFGWKAWVYFLKKLIDGCENFKIVKACVEKQSGHTIKILRIDWGTITTRTQPCRYCPLWVQGSPHSFKTCLLG